MDKKSYVLKVLSLVSDVRPLADGLMYLVQKDSLDDATLDVLMTMLQKSVQTADSDIAKEKLNKAGEMLQKIKEAEQQDHQLDQQDISSLEQEIARF